MELKNYQKKVMEDLVSYLDAVNNSCDLKEAWESYWFAQDICVNPLTGVPPYEDDIQGVPHVCMKVPTGGGKTLMACAAIKKIFDAMPLDKPRVVVWLVPSDSILEQTVKTLSDVTHPYRQRLDVDFGGRVGVYTKEMLLNAQNFSPDTMREMMMVCVLSYSCLRIDDKKKDVRKVYQENGNLIRFAEYFSGDDVLLKETPDTALIQVLRHLSPITIVDESHNACSDLSVQMLNNLNPSFILDLTATPRNKSNIISYVDARELKKEHMVKLPVVVYNRASRSSVLQDAIQLRGSIERQAIEAEQSGGEYIRPIVLFQAQPNINDDNETFNKLKEKLLDAGIPEEEVAIKTSEVNELSGVDLLSQDCKIRYIITVNALKEGWDCPFAYVLASMANKTSQVDVEQILGRILRQPYAKQHSAPLLNTSYVLTCSNDFHNTLDKVVVGLNKAGYSKKDYREYNESDFIADTKDKTEKYRSTSTNPDVQAILTTQQENSNDDFEDIASDVIRDVLDNVTENNNPGLTAMEEAAERAIQDYAEAQKYVEQNGLIGGELGEKINQYKVQTHFAEDINRLLIPQFFYQTIPDLFGDESVFLDKAHLSEGFSLDVLDAQISFEFAIGEMYSVDIEEQGDAVPKYKRISKRDSDYIREYLSTVPTVNKVNCCIDLICNQINKNNQYSQSEIRSYVTRIIQRMNNTELSAMETSVPTYAIKILKKIESLEEAYRERQFYNLLDSSKIFVKESYSLPNVITPSSAINRISKSLYESESNNMDKFEQEVIEAVVGLQNIKWWHRIIARRGFYINAFINHYPDFMVMTNSGKIILIETKGDYLDGDDSKTKLKLGRKWQDIAGDNFRYYMVFKDRAINEDGAFTFDRFIEKMHEL